MRMRLALMGIGLLVASIATSGTASSQGGRVDRAEANIVDRAEKQTISMQRNDIRQNRLGGPPVATPVLPQNDSRHQPRRARRAPLP